MGLVGAMATSPGPTAGEGLLSFSSRRCYFAMAMGMSAFSHCLTRWLMNG